MKNYIIDAKDKKLGRLASELSILLMGKNLIDYKKNIVSDVNVSVINASKIKIDNKKMKTKTTSSYSGYPGGLKKEKIEKTIQEKGFSGVIKNAVKGMLPDNRLRNDMMKRLKISE